jgi:hypothetical protein
MERKTKEMLASSFRLIMMPNYYIKKGFLNGKRACFHLKDGKEYYGSNGENRGKSIYNSLFYRVMSTCRKLIKIKHRSLLLETYNGRV